MTISAGASGLILAGSPPMSAIASRMVARSTTHGTPVKSCMITRAGVNWISLLGSDSGSQPARARMSSAVMLAPSSVRSRFSSRIFRLYGRVSCPSTASRRKISYEASPTARVDWAPKLLTLIASPWGSMESILTSRYHAGSSTRTLATETSARTTGSAHPATNRRCADRSALQHRKRSALGGQDRDRLQMMRHREQVEGPDAGGSVAPGLGATQVAGEGSRVTGHIRDRARGRRSITASITSLPAPVRGGSRTTRSVRFGNSGAPAPPCRR